MDSDSIDQVDRLDRTMTLLPHRLSSAPPPGEVSCFHLDLTGCAVKTNNRFVCGMPTAFPATLLVILPAALPNIGALCSDVSTQIFPGVGFL